MTNEYYTPQPDVVPGSRARSGDLNALDNGIAAAFDKLPSPDSLSAGTLNTAQDTGLVANAYVITLPKITSYTDLLSVKINTTRANTGAATLNINGIGAIAIKRLDNTDLEANDIQANAPVALTYVQATNRFMMPNLVASQIKQAATSASNAAASALAADASADAAADSATAAAASAASIVRDGSGGVVGLTGFALNLFNAAGTIKSALASVATAIRTWTMPDKSGTVALTSDIMGRNRIINGNFPVNQRGVAGTVTLAAGAYGHDMWKAGAGGCTYTFATNGCDTTITITAGTLMQVIEGVKIEGGIYTMSRSGTAQARIGINGATPSGAYAAAPITTATATAGQSISVEFGTGTLTTVQIEPGAVVTPFERRDPGAETTLCQRYGFALRSGSGVAASATIMQMYITFPVPMRVNPTVTATAPITVTDATTDFTQSAFSSFFNGVDTTGGVLNLENFTGLTPLRVAGIRATGGKLFFSAGL